MIAVCLLTCGREDYTQRTIDSFLAHNDPSRFILLHADDASPGNANFVAPRRAGFETIYAAVERQGQADALWALVTESERRGAEWVLWLENDWEWLAPFPFDALRYGAQCVRLYGDLKAPGNPAGRFIMGTKRPIVWHDVGEAYQRGEAHWAGPPSATRTYLLAGILEEADSLKAISLSGPLDTLRVKDSIVRHIGTVQTPDFMP